MIRIYPAEFTAPCIYEKIEKLGAIRQSQLTIRRFNCTIYVLYEHWTTASTSAQNGTAALLESQSRTPSNETSSNARRLLKCTAIARAPQNNDHRQQNGAVEAKKWETQNEFCVLTKNSTHWPIENEPQGRFKKLQTLRDLHVGKLCTAANAPMLCERSPHERSKWRQIHTFRCAALERSIKPCSRYGVLPISSVTLILDLDKLAAHLHAMCPLLRPPWKTKCNAERYTKEKGGTYISRKIAVGKMFASSYNFEDLNATSYKAHTLVFQVSIMHMTTLLLSQKIANFIV